MAGLDTSPLGVLCAQAMEQLSERYDEREVSLRTVALVLEVEDADGSDVLVTSTDSRPWVQIAFLGEGIATVEDLLDAYLRAEED